MDRYTRDVLKTIPRNADFVATRLTHFDGASDEWGFPQETRVVDVAFTSDPIAMQHAAALVVDAETFEIVKDRTGRVEKCGPLVIVPLEHVSGAPLETIVKVSNGIPEPIAARRSRVLITSNGIPEPVGTDDEITWPHRSTRVRVPPVPPRPTRAFGSVRR